MGIACSAARRSNRLRTGRRKNTAQIVVARYGGQRIRKCETPKSSIHTYALDAVSGLNQIVQSVCIVQQLAMLRTETEAPMTEQLTRRVAAYRTAMSIIKEMLKQGLISADDYAKIDTKMTEKYGLKSSTIFR